MRGFSELHHFVSFALFFSIFFIILFYHQDSCMKFLCLNKKENTESEIVILEKNQKQDYENSNTRDCINIADSCTSFVTYLKKLDKINIKNKECRKIEFFLKHRNTENENTNKNEKVKKDDANKLAK